MLRRSLQIARLHTTQARSAFADPKRLVERQPARSSWSSESGGRLGNSAAMKGGAIGILVNYGAARMLLPDQGERYTQRVYGWATGRDPHSNPTPVPAHGCLQYGLRRSCTLRLVSADARLAPTISSCGRQLGRCRPERLSRPESCRRRRRARHDALQLVLGRRQLGATYAQMNCHFAQRQDKHGPLGGL